MPRTNRNPALPSHCVKLEPYPQSGNVKPAEHLGRKDRQTAFFTRVPCPRSVPSCSVARHIRWSRMRSRPAGETGQRPRWIAVGGARPDEAEAPRTRTRCALAEPTWPRTPRGSVLAREASQAPLRATRRSAPGSFQSIGTFARQRASPPGHRPDAPAPIERPRVAPAPRNGGDDDGRQGSSPVAVCSVGAQAAVARSPGLSGVVARWRRLSVRSNRRPTPPPLPRSFVAERRRWLGPPRDPTGAGRPAPWAGSDSVRPGGRTRSLRVPRSYSRPPT